MLNLNLGSSSPSNVVVGCWMFWAKNIIKVLYFSVCWIILLFEVCLRGHNWVHFSHRPQCTVTMNWNFTILKPEIVFNWNIFEPIVLWKKGKGFLLFLKAFSWKTDLLVTLCDFTVIHTKLGKGNLYLTENWFSRNEMWCVVVNYNHMGHIMWKGFLD